MTEKEQARKQREVQLQQQITNENSYYSSQFYSLQQSLNEQLRAAQAEQERKLREINENHQRELARLRQNYQNYPIYEQRCSHTGKKCDAHIAYLRNNYNYEDYSFCSVCDAYTEQTYVIVGNYNNSEGLTREEEKQNQRNRELTTQILQAQRAIKHLKRGV